MTALKKNGIDLDIVYRLGELVKEKPFVDVLVQEIKMPHGTWSQGTFEFVCADQKTKSAEGLGPLVARCGPKLFDRASD